MIRNIKKVRNIKKIKKPLLTLVCLWLPLAPASALACAMHMGFNPDEMGFVSGTLVRMAGLAPPKPVFEIDHPTLARASIGETNEIVVNYSRPSSAKNVEMKLTGTRNIVIPESVIVLDEKEGSVSIAYELTGSGYDSITLEVTGEHKGETVRQVARIYVRANKIASTQEQKVSSR